MAADRENSGDEAVTAVDVVESSYEETAVPSPASGDPTSIGDSASVGGGPAATTISAMTVGSWFSFAFWLAAGGLTAYMLVQTVSGLGSVLSLLLLAVFFATALDPAVTSLVNKGLRRSLAVTIVALCLLAVVAGFIAIIVPPVDREVTGLVNAIPRYLNEIKDKSTYLGRLETKYQFVEKAQSAIKSATGGGNSSSEINNILGAGKAVFSALTGTLAVVALTMYFLANMPSIKTFAYRLVPINRRPRVSELSDRILAQVGRYVVGQAIIASIAGLATFVWSLAWGIPYAAALGVLVALFGLIPVVGSSIGGAVVTLVALSVSVPVAITTLVYYVAARLAEDYLVAPRVNRRTVDVHPLVTILAVLTGGALLGIIGALVAIPVAVAIRLIATEVVLPRIDDL